MQKLISTAKGRKSAFTLVEILIVIAILAILAVVTFVVINPVQRVDQGKDTRRREEVNNILSAITLYTVDNDGTRPTAGGNPLPTVTTANILTTGADASDLDNLGTSLTEIPVDPDGLEYKVGLLNGTTAIVGILLSDGTTYTKSE